jgi:hypothetical protein
MFMRQNRRAAGGSAKGGEKLIGPVRNFVLRSYYGRSIIVSPNAGCLDLNGNTQLRIIIPH